MALEIFQKDLVLLPLKVEYVPVAVQLQSKRPKKQVHRLVKQKNKRKMVPFKAPLTKNTFQIY